MSDLAAVVTGSARGIGWSAAQALCRRGYSVAVTDLDLEAAHAAAAQLKGAGRAVGLAVDVGDSASVDAMMAAVVDLFGGVDVLVNNAGHIRPGAADGLSDDDWNSVLNVHLTGTFRCSRAAYPTLKKRGGAIVNVASIAGRVGIANRSSYCAAKAGIESLTRALAMEWAADGIRVNAVAPGYTLTPLNRSAVADGTLDEARVMARVPMRRLAESDEIAAGIAFLASEEASYITGQVLVIDGGLTVNGNW